MEENKVFDYNSGEGIQQLRGLTKVSMRPGMYIGGTGIKPLHHLIWECVDNSVDECMAGYATRIIVTMTKEGSIRVDDDGRGIPTAVSKDDEKHRTGLEIALCEVHAGGKYDKGAYKISGGLNGVGIKAVNALSNWTKVWVSRDNNVYYLEFTKNDWYHAPKGPQPEAMKLEDGSQTIPGDLPNVKPHGTIIEFMPNFDIMEENRWDYNVIAARLKNTAYLNSGVKIVLIDEYTNPEEPTKVEWCFEGGIKQYVEDLNKDKEPLVPTIVYGKKQGDVKAPNATDQKYSIICEFALQYTKNYTTSLYSYCNNVYTSEGGTHEDGFKLALVRLINKYAIEKKLMKEIDDKVTKEDVVEGLTAIISLKHEDPQYKGQTKGELQNTEVRPFVNEMVGDCMEKYLLENPAEAEMIIKKIVFAKQARIKAQEAREATRRKSPFDSGSMPGKLADCSCKDPSICEIYLVEGDSAGGSAKSGRNSFYQAILPLRGKILNVEKVKTERIFENEEINAMITAFGIGVSPEFKWFQTPVVDENGNETKDENGNVVMNNVLKPRYDKIIIMTDADVDGAHIRILLLTFFFRYLKPLIELGHVYSAVPPLYKVFDSKNNDYAYSDEELEQIKAKYGTEKYSKMVTQRYKGLGEMDPEQLWETTMDPENRILRQVTIDEAALADQQFSFLMGDETQPRKDFIAKNAKFAKNIDI